MRREPLTAARFPWCLFTPLVERQMILVDHQCSIRQICRSAYIETAISVPFVGMTDVKQTAPLFELRLEPMCNCPEPAFASQEFSVIHSSDGATAFSVGRVRWPRTGLSCTEPQGVSAIRLRSLARS